MPVPSPSNEVFDRIASAYDNIEFVREALRNVEKAIIGLFCDYAKLVC